MISSVPNHMVNVSVVSLASSDLLKGRYFGNFAW